jgi:hypothetical protein
MTPAFWGKAVAVWLAILVLANLNGLAREFALAPALGPVGARLASGVLLCGIILLVACLAAPWLGRASAARWWAIGALWLGLTLAFELGIGYAQHQDLSRLLDAYTFQGGNIWPVVLLAALVSPYFAARARGLLAPRADKMGP